MNLDQNFDYDDAWSSASSDFDMYWGLEEPYWKTKKHPFTRFRKFVSSHIPYSDTIYKNRRSAVAIAISSVIFPFWAIYGSSNGYWDRYLQPEASSRTLWVSVFAVTCISYLTAFFGPAGPSLFIMITSIGLGNSLHVTKDFYFLIQATSLFSATIMTIACSREIEYKTLIWGSLGGVIGVIAGLSPLIPHSLSEAYAIMYIASIYLAFALSIAAPLPWHNGRVFRVIVQYKDFFDWKTLLVICIGFIGGVLSSVAGPGVELCMFSLLIHVFYVSETVATPTVVGISAVTCIAAALYRTMAQEEDVDTEAKVLWFVCLPTCTLSALAGTLSGPYLHRITITCVILITSAIQFSVVIVYIQPWTNAHTYTPIDLCMKSSVLMFASLVSLAAMHLSGRHILGFTWRCGLYDEAWNGTGQRIGVKKRIPAQDDLPALEVLSETKSEISDLSGVSWCLYAPKMYLTPPDRENAPVLIIMEDFSDVESGGDQSKCHPTYDFPAETVSAQQQGMNSDAEEKEGNE